MTNSTTRRPQPGGTPKPAPQQDQSQAPAPQQGQPPVIKDWAAI